METSALNHHGNSQHPNFFTPACPGVGHLVTVLVGNALDMDLSEATAIFLYLVPRGLRIMLPRLVASPRPRRVATYMAGFENVTPVATEKVQLLSLPMAD